MALLLAAASCARRTEPASTHSAPADSKTARAIGRDRPERLVLPLAPPGAGQVVYERVAPARATLDLPLPSAEATEPPPSGAATASDSVPLVLKPPIPRGSPRVVRGGRGGRVTLDVRVDETGEVSDVALVETDTDSLTVLAATHAALGLRYYPAILGERRIAVWTRQVFDVARGRDLRP